MSSTNCKLGSSLIRNGEGSVLMETLMVIPLFTVLLGGMIWIADLYLARHRLTTADRYAAWNAGVRHRGAGPDPQAEIQTRFFEADPFERVQAIEVTRQAVGTWYNVTSARMPIRVIMPIWTRGWLAVADLAQEGSPAPTMGFTQQYYSRRDGPHGIVMRQAAADRFAEGRDISWTGVFSEEWWPSSLLPSLPGIPFGLDMVDEHDRSPFTGPNKPGGPNFPFSDFTD